MAQEESVRPTYVEIKKVIDSGRLKKPHLPTLLGFQTGFDYEKEIVELKNAYFSVYLNMVNLLPELYALKTAAFREELEWRLIDYLLPDDYDSCLYRALNDRIIPYKAFDFTKWEPEVITDVRIGPKNITPVHVVKGFLKKHGFKNVTVSRSSATYR
jgi:hypothetical protein